MYQVVNGACKHGDMAHFKEQMALFKGDVRMEYREDLSLLALQGPGSAAALQKLLPASVNLAKVGFMVGFDSPIAGIAGCRVTRCGYTGEDGFELAVPNEKAVALAEALFNNPTVNPLISSLKYHALLMP